MAKRSNWSYYLEKVPGPLRNKFVVATTLFVLWMFFFDRNSIISQYRLQVTLQELKNKKAYFTEEIKQAERDNRELFTSEASREKFAREHYFMKRKDEDVFIIVEEEQ